MRAFNHHNMNKIVSIAFENTSVYFHNQRIKAMDGYPCFFLFRKI